MKAIDDEFRPPSPEYLSLLEKKKKGYSFKSETMADLLARPTPVIEWLIEDIWVDKSRGLIAGNPGIGKTWMALEMMFSVSSGLPCLGKYAVKQGGALLVEEESSVMNLARRIHCMARGRGILDSDLVNFHHITRQFVKIPQHEKEMIAFIKAHSIKLVVFDSLRRFHGADENSSEKMQPVLDSFARINTDGGCSVVLIHHLAKQMDKKADKRPVFERMRGTSDLWAWRDCIIGVEGETGGTVTDCSFQFRDAETPESIQVKRHVDDVSGAIHLAIHDPEDADDFMDKAETIMDYLRDHQPCSKDQVVKKIGGRKENTIRVFDACVKKGLVVKNGYKFVVPDFTGTHGNDGNE